MSSISTVPIFWVGLDVHKESVTAAVFRNRDAEPLRVDRLPNDHKRIRRYFERLTAAGRPRVCYEASMVLATELGDLRRFEDPRQLMSYLGLVPSEHSYGDRRRQGAITKAGNSRCRHVLVQAAWCYRRRPAVGVALKRRQEGQDPSVIAHAWKAQHRLYKIFHRLAAKKPKQVAATAVARELIGFIWAVLQDLDIAQRSTADERDEREENAHAA